MKEEKDMILSYEAPQLEVIEVEVEKGFATSNEMTVEEFEQLMNGGEW